MAETSRYMVLRVVDLDALAAKIAPTDAGAVRGKLPKELYEPVGVAEGSDAAAGIEQAAKGVPGEYRAVPAARWEANQGTVEAKTVVSVTVTMKAKAKAKVPA